MFQDLLDRVGGHFCCETENPLMALSLSFAVQPGFLFERDPDMVLPGQFNDLLDSRIPLTAFNADPFNVFGICLQCLGDRINSVQERHITDRNNLKSAQRPARKDRKEFFCFLCDLCVSAVNFYTVRIIVWRRSRQDITLRGKFSRLPSSYNGISFSNSGPESRPVSAARIG